MVCEYKLVKCRTCLSEMPQQDLSAHQLKCTSALMSSENYYTTSQPNAPPSFYAEIDNLLEQFEQLRQQLSKNQSNFF